MRIRTSAKRQEILAIATETFIEMGYDRASMAEISTRVGGSKATLYGYFQSKEQLFLAVMESVGEEQVCLAFGELAREQGDIADALRRFGERLINFLFQPTALATQRVAIAEAGRSAIGRHFFDAGPRRGEATVTAFMQTAMAAGQLREADPLVAAQHLGALLQAEFMPHCLFGVKVNLTRKHVRAAAARAVSVFMAAYGP